MFIILSREDSEGPRNITKSTANQGGSRHRWRHASSGLFGDGVPWVRSLASLGMTATSVGGKRLHVAIQREFVRMRTETEGVVFLLLHLGPILDEVNVENVAPKQKCVIGLQRFDRATE
jgi:hypothetical protein